MALLLKIKKKSLHKSRTRTMGGAGLGLALVAEIAQLHNGTVYVSESDSEGSTIILKLPL